MKTWLSPPGVCLFHFSLWNSQVCSAESVSCFHFPSSHQAYPLKVISLAGSLELPVQELFFCMMLSLKGKHFSRLYKHCLRPQWKQTTFSPECPIKASKSRDQQGARSNGQERELVARRESLSWIYFLKGHLRYVKFRQSSVKKMLRLLLSPVERNEHL